jgi:SAM-dependent methyltransferase
MPGPDRQFWQDRFENRQTPWDRGAPNPQLARWLDEGVLAPTTGGRPTTILVPGCGSGHEVALLAQRGFDVTGLDYAEAAVRRARDALAASAPAAVAAGLARVDLADVLDWRPAAPVDAVYEQTCLCALHPDQWTRYATALQAWLRPEGRLLLLAMQSPKPGGAEGFVEGPPYHLHIHAVRALFAEPAWAWCAPPYPRVPHPSGWEEIALVLQRR